MVSFTIGKVPESKKVGNKSGYYCWQRALGEGLRDGREGENWQNCPTKKSRSESEKRTKIDERGTSSKYEGRTMLEERWS